MLDQDQSNKASRQQKDAESAQIKRSSNFEECQVLLNKFMKKDARNITAEDIENSFELAISTGFGSCLLIYFSYADFEECQMNFEKVHSIYKRAIQLQSVETTLVYIQYMRFARRAEGVNSARAVFKMAREDPRSKYHVYVSAAHMERYNEKSIALKIFDLAFKKFGTQYEFVKEFLDFSVKVNDYKNTKALFEKILAMEIEPREKLPEIWNMFVDYERKSGCLSDIINSEERRKKIFSEFENIERPSIVGKYNTHNIYPSSSYESQSIDEKKPTDVVKFKVEDSKQNKIVCASGLNSTNNLKENCLPEVTKLLKILMPPSSYKGPLVIVDQLMGNFLLKATPHNFPNITKSSGNNHIIKYDADKNLKRKRLGNVEEAKPNNVPMSSSNGFVERQKKKLRCFQ